MLLAAVCIGAAHADTVRLTSADVDSAQDIEAAINAATNAGTTPGTVILDGRDGRFTFPELGDQSIDITVSRLTLAGTNAAAVDGVLVFGNAAVNGVVVENLEIRSPFEEGVAVLGTGANVTRNVTLRDNVFRSELSAVFVANATDWKIIGNRLVSGADEGAAALTLLGARDCEIIGNTVTSGAWGLLLTASPLRDSRHNTVVANRVSAFGRGIVLNAAAADNTVLLNHVSLAASSDTVVGIFLDSGTTGNRVLLNRARTAAGGSLDTVQDLGTGNRLFGNRP
jgi:hypothetical protein